MAAESAKTREAKLAEMLLAEEAKADAKEKPELYDVIYGPYNTPTEAIAERDKHLSHKGFPMVSKSTIMQTKDGYDLRVTFRSRFPASLPKPEKEEPLLDFIPSGDGDKKDQKD